MGRGGPRAAARFPWVPVVGLLVALLWASSVGGCRSTLHPPPPGYGRRIMIEATGYCPCGKCCGWVRNWYGRVVYAYGPNKGKPKKVGICADGTKARRGTAAADTRYYPFGTRLYVPGYGYATVQDRGGDIRGPYRIDLYFPTHGEALQWGRLRVPVTVLPGR